MAVVTRKRRHTTTFYVTTWFEGETYWERAGTDKREAQRLSAQRKREVKAGEYTPPRRRRVELVGPYLAERLAVRDGRNAKNEAHEVRRLVIDAPSFAWFCALRMDAVKPRDLFQLVEELRRVPSVNALKRGEPKAISEKTVANVYGVIRSIFREAHFLDVIQNDPCTLPKKTFKRRGGKRRGRYDRETIPRILAAETRKPADRVLAALAFYTGMREGEICGRRWRDIDWGTEPLALLNVHTQYHDQPLKTEDEVGEQPRVVPVHPELAAVLRAWWREGWERAFLIRGPRADDFIVPRKVTAETSRNHTRSSAYKAWRRVVDVAGVENISLHSTRHTFVTFARQVCDGQTAMVETITHNAKGTTIDGYTHYEWAPLCRIVARIAFGVPETGTSPDGGPPPDVDADVDALSSGGGGVGGGAGNRTEGASGTRRNLADKQAVSDEGGDTGEPPSFSANTHGHAEHAARQREAGSRGPRVRRAIRRAVDLAVARDEVATTAAMHRAGRLLGHEVPSARRRRAGGAA